MGANKVVCFGSCKEDWHYAGSPAAAQCSNSRPLRTPASAVTTIASARPAPSVRTVREPEQGDEVVIVDSTTGAYGDDLLGETGVVVPYKDGLAISIGRRGLFRLDPAAVEVCEDGA